MEKRFSDNIAIVLFVLLPLTSVLSISKYILLAGIFVLLIVSFSYGEIRRELRYISWSENSFGLVNLMFIAQYIWFGVSVVINGIDTNGIIRIVQLFGCQLSINLGRIVGGQKIKLDVAKKTIRAIILIAFTHWIFTGRIMMGYMFIYNNPNTFGSILLMWLVVLNSKSDEEGYSAIKTIIYIIGVLLLFCTSARASLVALLIYMIVMFLYSKHTINKKVFNLMFYLMIVSALAFVSIYLKLTTSAFAQQLSEISVRLSNKNFFSGRQRVWVGILNSVLENPYIGYGISATPSYYFDIDASSHNLFLQVAFQVGLPGLMFLIFTLKSVYNCCIGTNGKNSLVGCAMILLIIIHESFEVSLTQNMLVVGLQMWFILGCGCSLSDTAESVQKNCTYNSQLVD